MSRPKSMFWSPCVASCTKLCDINLDDVGNSSDCNKSIEFVGVVYR